MKIGILSDTHDDTASLQKALQRLRQRGVSILFHCGDLTSVELVSDFSGFEVFIVRGNMDSPQIEALKAQVRALPNGHWLGAGTEVELDGVRIAVAHGDREDVVQSLLLTEPDYLFTGHTHRHRDERSGATRLINPGALGGVKYEARSFCVLDLLSDRLDVILV